ncbi:MAG: 2-oxo acid dehydrogenase subunit E2 [Nocardioidaceae bacterium]|nr:2-oxo acid dehydrogenase subunit E2 [Nocardioidaceae bacterium]
MSADTETASAGTATPLKGIRRTAARRMTAAWEAPVFHLTASVDMTNAAATKNAHEGATLTDVLLRACSRALVKHPAINAHYGGEVVTTFDEVNLGLAVATDAGLMVPVVHGTQALDLAGIAAARGDVVSRARIGKLGYADIDGGTFTVSNLGPFGIDRFDAILNVPQVAILAVGSTAQRQVWNDGDPQWRPVAELTLTCDHRAVDGATGARFLADLVTELQSAELQSDGS